MDFGFILPKLVMIFTPMLAAYLAVKCGLWNKDGNKVLSTAVTYLTNPATVISSAISGARPLSNSQVFTVTAIAVACHLLLIAVSFLIPRILGVQQDKRKVYRGMFIFTNIGYFGLPVCTALFGASAAFLVAIFILPFQLLMFTYGVLLLGKEGGERKFSPRMLLHPMILACSAAYILYLLNPAVPAVIREPLAFVGQATSPIAMMVVGGTLAFAPLKKVFLNWRLYLLAAVKMLLVPVCVLFLLRALLPLTDSTRLMIGVTVTVMSGPTAALTTMVANLYGGDTETTSSGVCLTTLFTVLSIPLMTALLGAVL